MKKNQYHDNYAWERLKAGATKAPDGHPTPSGQSQGREARSPANRSITYPDGQHTHVKVCERCGREVCPWPLRRGARCSPKGWAVCIRNDDAYLGSCVILDANEN